MSQTQEVTVEQAVRIAERMEEGPWVKLPIRSSSGSIHTRKGCSLLNQSNGKQEASIGQIRYHDLVECKKCRKLRKESDLIVNGRTEQASRRMMVRVTKKQMDAMIEAKNRDDTDYNKLSDVGEHCIDWFCGEQESEQQPWIDKTVHHDLDEGVYIRLSEKQLKQISKLVSNGKAPNKATVVRGAIVAHLFEEPL